jgi:GMP synthase (glutamine-hydrolysing)
MGNLNMKTLLINCYAKNWRKKKKNYLRLLQGFGDVEIKKVDDISGESDIQSYDAIVLTGSGKDITKGEYTEEFLDFLRNVQKPLLGICYGHQVIAHAFGCSVELGEQMTHKYEENPHSVLIQEKNDLFWDMDAIIQVDEDHHEYVLKEGIEKRGFILLASSSSCPVEAMKLRSKPTFGIQFHPERSGEVGKKIIENFFLRVVGKSIM